MNLCLSAVLVALAAAKSAASFRGLAALFPGSGSAPRLSYCTPADVRAETTLSLSLSLSLSLLFPGLTVLSTDYLLPVHVLDCNRCLRLSKIRFRTGTQSDPARSGRRSPWCPITHQFSLFTLQPAQRARTEPRWRMQRPARTAAAIPRITFTTPRPRSRASFRAMFRARGPSLASLKEATLLDAADGPRTPYERLARVARSVCCSSDV